MLRLQGSNRNALSIKSFRRSHVEYIQTRQVGSQLQCNHFFQMLTNRGGLDTARFLINTPKESDGYTALYLRGRLDLTVEAMVVENTKWHKLFTSEELEKARARLKKYEYIPRNS
jgi:hypothetical protein